tara:strand:- start:201 stop:431 length:231 start_codon:yes stop_codon:yes gene_type:complete
MIKLKKILKESAWDRKFGEPLPTLEDVVEKHNVKEESMNEHTVVFSKDDMEKLHRDGKLIKADSDGKDHTYIYSED